MFWEETYLKLEVAPKGERFSLRKSGRDGKKWSSFSYSAGEKLSEHWNFIHAIF